MNNYYGVDFAKQRECVLKSKAAKSLIDYAIDRADKAIENKLGLLNITEYMSFMENGDRRSFENKYYERRNDCSYTSVAYWLTEDEKYKNKLIDLIFNICDEYTWCVPAHALLHDKPSSSQVVESIDLAQSQTARLLTDIAVLVGEKLPYYVNDRIEYEIRRRIIEPMKSRKYYWQKSTTRTNWASVCPGCVVVALLTFGTEEEISQILPMLQDAIENFLLGYNDDGCCLEGCNYWDYGFGYFVMFARMVAEYTKGKINYFEREKIKKIATFMQKVRMGKERIVSFSDSSCNFSFSPGLLSYLKRIYPDDIVLPPLSLGTLQGNIYSIKELLWFDTEYCEQGLEKETVFFENAQWFISRKDKFSFAAKAGHNNEPHNHNDVGSFMIITKNDDIPLADFGSALYTRETFDPEHRYNIINNSSRGHSVPIINGECQGADDEHFCAKNVKAGENFFEADIEGAYPKGLINRLNRRFDITGNSIILCDSYEFSDKTKEVTERFVSWTKPEINDGYVELKSAGILYDTEKYNVTYTEDSYTSHQTLKEVKVYLIDFKLKSNDDREFNIEIVVND